MRVIIAGSRGITDYAIVEAAIAESLFIITVVLSGSAAGVDKLGERWGRENGRVVVVYPADWSKHGKSAGPIRNQMMAQNADALIAIWDGKSRGTKNMIDTAKRFSLSIHVKQV